MSRPIERAEKCAGCDLAIGFRELTAADPGFDEGANALLVEIALGQDRVSKLWRQRCGLEMRRRSLDFVEQTEHMGGSERAKPFGNGCRRLGARAVGGRDEPIERAALAKEEDLVLACKVAIEISGRQVRLNGDVAHAGRGEAPKPEDGGCGAQNFEPAVIGPAAKPRGT